MFTGIVETMGKIDQLIEIGSNKSFWIESSFIHELKVDQSISHNGICLTVEEISGSKYKVTAIEETLKKTTAKGWEEGFQINLERCVKLGDRIDGHFVQGHVDTTGVCKNVSSKEGSWEFTIEFSKNFAPFIIEKGSIAVNGISLTAFNVTESAFTVAIIPFTYQHTDLKHLQAGTQVNLEFDMMGKYVQRVIKLSSQS